MAEIDKSAPGADTALIERIQDPDCVAVRHVTGVITQVFGKGSTIAMTLVTDRMGVTVSGGTFTDNIVAARLRFDFDVARLIRDHLDAHLSGITRNNTTDAKPN